MNRSKIVCALISFLGTGALTYLGVPMLAVVILMGLVITFTDFFIKKGDYKLDFTAAIIALIICIVTGNYYLGF